MEKIDFENLEILKISGKINDLKSEISKLVVWQEDMIDLILIAFLSKWHVLLEWAPGLAKTLTIDTFSKTLNSDFNRIQFTPDLLPSDLIWAKIYNQEENKFHVKKWPIFSNFILADEINRAPSKVQSALLEAMAEKQVSIWEKSFKLDEPFMVLATQNPIEQEWTFSLPEAQLDRFLFKIILDYPSKEEELEIMKLNSKKIKTKINPVLDKDDIFKLQDLVEDIYVWDKIYDYVNRIIFTTRKKEKLNSDKIDKYLLYWASPRASIAIIKTAKANAFLEKRNFVLPEDIKKVVYPILRHRIILNYESIADEISTDMIIKYILDNLSIS